MPNEHHNNLHSLRAYAFFKDEIEDEIGALDVTSPESINRIKDELPDIRAKSKSPSFAMAYGSGAGKIQELLKCSKAKAESVFNAYHELYKGTKDYADRSIEEAKRQGFTTGAYGLKLRTPRIKARDNQIASSEGRTLNNMRIQSYGLLTNRAGIDIQSRIEADNMQESIILVNQIHDALYFLVKDNPETVDWLNKNLIEVMVADYREDQVIHLEAELDVGPSWKTQVTIKNNASLEDIEKAINKSKGI